MTLSAASVLGEMGAAAKTAIPALKAARQNDLFTRKAALEALRAIETAQ